VGCVMNIPCHKHQKGRNLYCALGRGPWVKSLLITMNQDGGEKKCFSMAIFLPRSKANSGLLHRIQFTRFDTFLEMRKYLSPPLTKRAVSMASFSSHSVSNLQ
jgi:hypothetical protein